MLCSFPRPRRMPDRSGAGRPEEGRWSTRVFPSKNGVLPLRFVAVVLSLAIVVTPAWASQRVALVIGNAGYAHAPALATPLNDAADVGAAFELLGFAVTRVDNVDQVTLRRSLRDFASAAQASDGAVVFYSGHAIAVENRNFLVPVDARLSSDQDIEFETVPLELVEKAVERASHLRLVILDACRESSFAESMRRTGSTREIGLGLAPVEPSGDTLVAYAAKGGTLARKAPDRNSPYTKALLRYLQEPGLELGLMLNKVHDAVLEATDGSQEPFVYGSLPTQGTYFGARPEPSQTVQAPGTASELLKAEKFATERLFWDSMKHSQDPAELRAYLDQYPDGTFASLARARLEGLGPRDRAVGSAA